MKGGGPGKEGKVEGGVELGLSKAYDDSLVERQGHTHGHIPHAVHLPSVHCSADSVHRVWRRSSWRAR